jgi:hypothetical protein
MSRSTVALEGVVRDVDELEELVRGAAPAALAAGPCVGFDDDWAQAARTEHVRRCVAVLDALAAAADDPAEAAHWSARRCALTPLDELAHSALLERLAAAGDRAGALVGRELALRLRAELGVAPTPATRASWPGSAARVPPTLMRGPCTDVRAGTGAGRADRRLVRGAERTWTRRTHHRRGRDGQEPTGGGARAAGGQRRSARRRRSRSGRRRRGTAGPVAGARPGPGGRRAPAP